MATFPPEVRRLLWDIDPDALDLDLERHLDYLIERVMTRGSLAAMRWLRAHVPRETLADFLCRRGDRLSPRDRSYWRLVSGMPPRDEPPGGGRPPWLT